MPTTLYGIPNCDTVRRARAWLAENGVEARFHDLRKDGVPSEGLALWCERLGWEAVLNTRGTTWRGLDLASREGVRDAVTACALMQANPSVIRRPVVQWPDGKVTIGFDAQVWADQIS